MNFVKIPMPKCLVMQQKAMDHIRKNVQLTKKQDTLLRHRLLAFFAERYEGLVFSRNCRRF